MIHLEHVLVATDFSPPSKVALTYGRALARTFGASLHLLHVAENQFLSATFADHKIVGADQTRWLEELLTSEDRETLHARAVVELSDATAATIVDYAVRSMVGLIVMGTNGRGTVAQLLMGSVAERVVRTASCPVLTVRHPEHDFVRSDSGGSETTMMQLKNILVATDFSEPSKAALAYGQELARTFNTSLTVLHVVEDMAVRQVGPDGFGFSDPSTQREIETSAQKQVDAIISDADRDMVGAQAVIRTSNATAPAIADFARESGVDLIVMGTHGRGAVAHLLMGSVAERVVRTAPCPVLTVRHPEHEFVLPDELAGRGPGLTVKVAGPRPAATGAVQARPAVLTRNEAP
jgi:nucleotide-binding universal stress UspA family protein